MLGSDHINDKGAIIEDILSTEHIVLLNTGASRHFSLQYDTFSAIDLSTARSAISYNWEPLDDLYGSNHYPLKIQSTSLQAYNIRTMESE